MLKFRYDLVCRVDNDRPARFYAGSYIVTSDYVLEIDALTGLEVFVLNYNGKRIYIPTEAVEEL